MDNRHHWQDVLVGSLVGLGFSFFSYRQYYPPLSAPDAHLPFEPRHMDLRAAVPTFFEGVRVAGGNNHAEDGVHDLERAAGHVTQHNGDDEEAGGGRGSISDSGGTDQAPGSFQMGYTRVQLHEVDLEKTRGQGAIGNLSNPS